MTKIMDPSFAFALAFFGFVALSLKTLWKKGMGALDNYSQKISQEFLIAKDLEEKARQLLTQTKEKQKDHEIQEQEIFSLAENEAIALVQQTQRMCQEMVRAKEHIFQEQSAFLLRQWREEISVALTQSMIRQIRKSIPENYQKISFDFMMRRLQDSVNSNQN